ncbi:DUF3298 and DUF4163 domain-containing protein [Clostridium sp.]|uniref:DUF3298 and DUF4163 domain-containing protein n=1 Tax=Clostridium sp. TaxID=1506 RepID=UPI003464C9E2
MNLNKNKRKIVKILIIIIFTFLNISVLNVEAITRKIVVSENKIKGKTDVLDMELNIPEIRGLENKDKEKSINEEIDKNAVAFGHKIKLLAEEDRKYYMNNKEDGDIYEAVVDFSTPYNNGEFLSLLIDNYSYTGGAHGITYRKSFNIDGKSGEVLLLKDLFKDNYNYKKIIDNIISKEIEKNKENFLYGEFNGIEEDIDFYMEEEYLIIYFQLYEIAPYVSGFPEFRIPIKELAKGLKKEFKNNF